MPGEMRYPDSKNGDSVEQGLEFQDFVMDVLGDRYGIQIQVYSSRKYQFQYGESRQRVEIKLDNRCTHTGRLSVETGEKTAVARDWVPSGILRDDNTWLYVHGNFKCFWIFTRSFLRQLYEAKGEIDGHRYERKEEETIRAFYLPITDADKYAERVQVEENGKMPF